VPLADQIEKLADNTLKDLRSGHDYSVHTKAAWRLVKRIVDQGYQLRLRNQDTGTTVNAIDLAGLSQRYVTVYLAESIFGHFVSLFEDFIFGLLRLWLLAYPAGIPNKEQKRIPLAMILDAPDKEAILRNIVDRELDELKYRRPAFWFQYLDDRVHLGCPSSDQIEQLAEIKATRDVLVHNSGIVNESYQGKSGSYARYSIQQRLEVPEPYLRQSWSLIRDLVQDMAASARAKATI